MLGKFLLRMLIGAGVITLCTAGMAPLYLLALIVCSQGKGVPLAILLAIPSCYLAGLLCSIWFIPFGPGPESYSKRRALAAKKNERKDGLMKAAIENYIAKALEKGMDKTDIFSQLIHNGWADSEINAAYEAVRIGTPDLY